MEENTRKKRREEEERKLKEEEGWATPAMVPIHVEEYKERKEKKTNKGKVERKMEK